MVKTSKEVLEKMEEIRKQDPEQASRCLGVAYSTLWLWAKSGKLVPYKIGKRVMYKTKDVYSLLNGETYENK